MLAAQWQMQFAKLPPGLTRQQMARALKQNYRLTCSWAKRLGVAARSDRSAAWTPRRRKELWTAPWDRIPFDRMSNVEIARQYEISRETVRQWRKRFQKQLLCNPGSKAPCTCGSDMRMSTR